MAEGTAKGETTVRELSRAQQIVARRVAESKATIPHLVLGAEVDMEACRALLVSGVAAIDAVVRACGLALREHPLVNGAYRDGRFESYGRVNVGVAVAVDDALVIPTIFDVDCKPLAQVAADRAAVTQRVRDGVATPPELSGATFTVFDFSAHRIARAAPVVSPSQAAALAIGAAGPRAVARDGAVVARHVLDATLACDHRMVYGTLAAGFLARVRELLEEPEGL
jgi:pyruvate dehydrogenase E2 component (dihydrolipoamide acetyltransferase)